MAEQQKHVPQGGEREGDASIFGAGDEKPLQEIDNIDSTGGGIDGIGAAEDIEQTEDDDSQEEQTAAVTRGEAGATGAGGDVHESNYSTNWNGPELKGRLAGGINPDKIDDLTSPER